MSYNNRITYYRDGATAKLNNRRVTISDDNQDGMFIEMNVLDGHKDRRARHEVHKSGVVTTLIRVKKESAFALYLMLKHFFKD